MLPTRFRIHVVKITITERGYTNDYFTHPQIHQQNDP